MEEILEEMARRWLGRLRSLGLHFSPRRHAGALREPESGLL